MLEFHQPIQSYTFNDSLRILLFGRITSEPTFPTPHMNKCCTHHAEFIDGAEAVNKHVDLNLRRLTCNIRLKIGTDNSANYINHLVVCYLSVLLSTLCHLIELCGEEGFLEIWYWLFLILWDRDFFFIPMAER